MVRLVLEFVTVPNANCTGRRPILKEEFRHGSEESSPRQLGQGLVRIVRTWFRRHVFGRLIHIRQVVFEVEYQSNLFAGRVVLVEAVSVRFEVFAVPDDLHTALLERMMIWSASSVRMSCHNIF